MIIKLKHEEVIEILSNHIRGKVETYGSPLRVTVEKTARGNKVEVTVEILEKTDV